MLLLSVVGTRDSSRSCITSRLRCSVWYRSNLHSVSHYLPDSYKDIVAIIGSIIKYKKGNIALNHFSTLTNLLVKTKAKFDKYLDYYFSRVSDLLLTTFHLLENDSVRISLQSCFSNV